MEARLRELVPTIRGAAHPPRTSPAAGAAGAVWIQQWIQSSFDGTDWIRSAGVSRSTAALAQRELPVADDEVAVAELRIVVAAHAVVAAVFAVIVAEWGTVVAE